MKFKIDKEIEKGSSSGFLDSLVFLILIGLEF